MSHGYNMNANKVFGHQPRRSKMSNNVVKGKVLRTEVAVKGSNDLVRKAFHLAGGARVLLIQHGERMENDPGYRDAFDHLVKLVSTKKGPVGENVQLLAAIQTFLTKAL
jgi:hypothetical protein